MTRIWRAALLVWMAVLMAGSLLPTTIGAPGGPGWHLLGYAVLGVLLGRGPALWLAWLLGFAYGALIEAIQWVLGYRAAEGADLVVNGLGVLVGLLGGRAALRFRRR